MPQKPTCKPCELVTESSQRKQEELDVIINVTTDKKKIKQLRKERYTNIETQGYIACKIKNCPKKVLTLLEFLKSSSDKMCKADYKPACIIFKSASKAIDTLTLSNVTKAFTSTVS
jgi:hypothetical protein